MVKRLGGLYILGHPTLFFYCKILYPIWGMWGLESSCIKYNNKIKNMNDNQVSRSVYTTARIRNSSSVCTFLLLFICCRGSSPLGSAFLYFKCIFDSLKGICLTWAKAPNTMPHSKKGATQVEARLQIQGSDYNQKHSSPTEVLLHKGGNHYLNHQRDSATPSPVMHKVHWSWWA